MTDWTTRGIVVTAHRQQEGAGFIARRPLPTADLADPFLLIVHSEQPARAIREHGGRGHGLQIWVNLRAQ